MRPIVVADSSPLIALAGCNCLKLLTEVFNVVHLPHAVLAETTTDPERPGAHAIASFVQQYAHVHADRHDAIYTRLIINGATQRITLFGQHLRHLRRTLASARIFWNRARPAS